MKNLNIEQINATIENYWPNELRKLKLDNPFGLKMHKETHGFLTRIGLPELFDTIIDLEIEFFTEKTKVCQIDDHEYILIGGDEYSDIIIRCLDGRVYFKDFRSTGKLTYVNHNVQSFLLFLIMYRDFYTNNLYFKDGNTTKENSAEFYDFISEEMRKIDPSAIIGTNNYWHKLIN